jgi:hypothetical protein
LNVFLPSTPRSPKWSFLFRSTDYYFVCIPHLSRACYMSRPSHISWFGHPNNIWRRVQIMDLVIIQRSLAQTCKKINSDEKLQRASTSRGYKMHIYFISDIYFDNDTILITISWTFLKRNATVSTVQ